MNLEEGAFGAKVKWGVQEKSLEKDRECEENVN